jgi:hypothetical protein
MADNKDPAFLLYSSDFLVGVSDMTMEERGQYITLLCLQHIKGHLTKKNILVGVGQVSDDVFAKFSIDDNGCYYNERLEKEVNKRKAYSESRKKNGAKKWEKEKHMQTENDAYASAYGYAYDMHTENVNGNKNIIKNIYGEFNNVLLTNTELDKLKEKYPTTYQKRIDDLSIYISSKGDKYKSHYHTILAWDRRNNEGNENSTFDADEMFEAALRKSYSEVDE